MSRYAPYPVRGRGRGRGGFPVQHFSSRRHFMSLSNDAVGVACKAVEEVKRTENEKKRQAEVAKNLSVMEAAAKAEDIVTQVQVLVDTVNPDSPFLNPVKNSSLFELNRWLEQARKDPGFSPDLLRRWKSNLEDAVRQSTARLDFTKLFGDLLVEWLGSGDSHKEKDSTKCGDLKQSDTPMTGPEPFQKIGRPELHEYQAKLESLIFKTPTTTDVTALGKYLENVFSNFSGDASLESVRRRISRFATDILEEPVTVYDVGLCIDSLLTSDLLEDDKRAILEDFSNNTTVLEEVAGALTMQLSNMDTWTWPEAGIPIEQRRRLDGQYRSYIDVETLLALFLQYIGLRWSVTFRSALQSMLYSPNWNVEVQAFTDAECRRRKVMLNESANTEGISSYRQAQRRFLFLARLPTAMNRKPPYPAESHSDQDNGASSDRIINPRQSLLHTLSTEVFLNMTTRGQLTILKSNVKDFAASLSHEHILAVLCFLGMPGDWVKFFSIFLATPARFESGPISVVKCGTPFSHAISTLLEELVLFVLDVAVNQSAGIHLYRLGDEFWLWNADASSCFTAWSEIVRFSSVFGLQLDLQNTGSACVGSDLHPGLPTGDICWGFLRFNAIQGTFTIDQQAVDPAVKEFRRQLAATSSILGFVKAYNAYLAFVLRSLGTPVNALGVAHINSIIDTLARVQREVLPDTDGCVFSHLRAMIKDRYGIGDIPFGWLLFPLEHGGLEVHNPMIELFAMRQSANTQPANVFMRELEFDRARYSSQMADWIASHQIDGQRPLEFDFMSFEEYISGREVSFTSWHFAYKALLSVPSLAAPYFAGDVQSAVGNCSSDFFRCGQGTEAYWKRVCVLHAEEMIEKFGTLEVAQRSMVPLGALSSFAVARVNWDQ